MACSLVLILTTVVALAAAQKCKPVTGTTTLTSYETINQLTATTTLTQTNVAAQVTVTRTIPSTVYYQPSEVYTTYSDTATVVVFKTLPAKRTVIVPTSAGFTAIRCEPAYQLHRTTITSSVTFQYNSLVVVYAVSTVSGSTGTAFAYSPTTTITEPPATRTIYPTITSTSTISSATTTKYEACGTNNIVGETPDKQSPIFGTSYGTSNSTSQGTYATSAEDCCNQCQQTPSCGFSLFGDTPQINKIQRCELFIAPESGRTCRGATVQGMLEYNPEFPGTYFSNGPCGQIDP